MTEKKNNSESLDQFKPKERVLLAWNTLEKEHYERGPLWYVGVFAFMILGVAYGIYSESWSSIIVFILLSAVAILYANNIPPRIRVFITEDGIYINKKIYPYKSIGVFWVIEAGNGIRRLGFRLKTGLQHEKEVILAEEITAEMIREVLKNVLPEDTEQTEGFISRLTRALKL